MASKRPDFGNAAGTGKIFIGGLAKETTIDTFVKYFGKYGDITDSVIMKDRATGRPRGFGFITYADPSVVDTVIAETHVINDKQVEIKRTIPKGSGESENFKTKKIFVGGIPATVTEDELKDFFSKYGKVSEHEIIRDHVTKRSRGFGFVVFESEQTVNEVLVNGYMVNMNGAQVEIKKAEPKKSSNTAPPSYTREYKKRKYGDSIEGYNGYAGNSGYGPPLHRSFNGVVSRFSDYGPPPPYKPVASEYSSEYAGYKSNAPPLDGHFSRGAYPYGVGVLNWFRPTVEFSHYDGPIGGGSYESGAGSGYVRAGAPYENRASYSGSSRYNTYGM